MSDDSGDDSGGFGGDDGDSGWGDDSFGSESWGEQDEGGGFGGDWGSSDSWDPYSGTEFDVAWSDVDEGYDEGFWGDVGGDDFASDYFSQQMNGYDPATGHASNFITDALVAVAEFAVMPAVAAALGPLSMMAPSLVSKVSDMMQNIGKTDDEVAAELAADETAPKSFIDSARDVAQFARDPASFAASHLDRLGAPTTVARAGKVAAGLTGSNPVGFAANNAEAFGFDEKTADQIAMGYNVTNMVDQSPERMVSTAYSMMKDTEATPSLGFQESAAPYGGGAIDNEVMPTQSIAQNQVRDSGVTLGQQRQRKASKRTQITGAGQGFLQPITSV